MNLIFAFDTETTGLPEWRSPSDAPFQPHIVQLGAVLADAETGNTIQSMDVIVKPDGWTIPQEAADVHGITNEMAHAVGISEEVALDMFINMWHRRLRVAHNQSFDERIIRIAMKRYNDHYLDDWKEGDKRCTALMAKPIMALPPTEKMKNSSFRNTFKTPNLTEAYAFFTGKALENAHSAMPDALACLEVYRAIKAGVTTDQAA